MKACIWELRGRCAVGQFVTGDKAAAERIVSRAIRNLGRGKLGWARAMSHKLRGSLELEKGNLQAAEAAFVSARNGFAQVKMRNFQHTAEAKLCEITGQLETARFQNVVDWFAAQEIQNPQAFTEMHYPTWGADANDHWSSYIKENGEV
jgi:hypothetical protein